MRLKNRFQKVIITILFIGLATLANAQTIKTVGVTGADYSTLKGAFDAINSGTLTGSITLQVIANTTETTTAVLNATASGTANYTAVNIYPTVSGLTITGNIAGPMIRLNGASNVTIDGSVNGLGAATDMIISNTSTSTSTTAGTSAIQLYGDATYNTIKYSNIQGSGNATIFNGIIMFVGVGTGTGNNNNTISNNNISSAGIARAGVAIYAVGVVGDVVTNNIVTNNNIFNFISNTKNSYGVYLDVYTSAWTISNNSIYETTTLTPTTGSLYYMIHVSSQAIGSNFTISGNFIGGSAPNAGGTALTKTSNSNQFIGIFLNGQNGGVANNIQGNTITNLNITNSSNNVGYGIFVSSGTVNIGTTSGNTIGASSGNGSISYTGTYSTAGVAFHGISISSGVNSSSPVNIRNNTVGSITASSSTGGVSVFGIYQNCGACTSNVSNNIIGSTTSVNSITASSTSGSFANDVVGIFSGSSSSFNNTISSNTIANLSNNIAVNLGFVLNGIQVNAGTTSVTANTVRDLTTNSINASLTNTAALSGINIVLSSLANVNNNTIYNLSNSSAAFAGIINGILMYSNTSNAHQFRNNFIYGLSLNSNASNAKISGINSYFGFNTFSNNIINISSNIPASVYGIFDQSTLTNNYYFNTVYLTGQAGSGANNSAAYFGNAGTFVRNISNNIFYNGRINSGTATGKHYGAYLNYSSSSTVILGSNDYYAITASGGVMAGTSSNATITQLPVLLNNDAGSFNIDPLFTIGTGLRALDYIPASSQLAGNVNGTGILTDYNGNNRNVANTSIGAFDYSVSGNISINSSAGTNSLTYSNLKSAFDAINAGIHQGSITIKLNGNTFESATAILNASGTVGSTGTFSGTSSYTSVTIYPTVSGVSIAGNLAAPLIDLNGADNVVIDGRVNATGSIKSLNLVNNSINTSATVSTIRFINDATNNTLRYSIVKGAAAGTLANANGVIFFSTATIIGNSNNIISNNDITGVSGIVRPNYLITSNSATLNATNKNNQVINNFIFDFLNPAASTNGSIGIYLSSNSDYFTITGNSFFETTNFTTTGNGALYFIYASSKFINLLISNNYLGGSAPSGQGTFTKTGGTNTFYGMYVYANNSVANNPDLRIQNNIVSNINYTNSATADFMGMFIQYGAGYTVSGNVIGSTSGNDAIIFKNTNSGNYFYGMLLSPSLGTSKAENNTVAAIKTDNVNQGNATNFYGIYAAPLGSGILNVFNNTIGSATVANSIIANSQATNASGQIMAGIYIPYSVNTATSNIIGNTICNLTNNAQGGVLTKTDQLIGIFAGGRTVYVSTNTIYNLNSETLNNTNGTSISNTAAISGISAFCDLCYLNDVNKNTIYNLNAKNAQFTGVVNGIKSITPNPSGVIRFNSNFIYNLKLNSSSVGANVYGINLTSAYNTYTYNNIITIGEDIPATYYGIFVNEVLNGNKYEFFNTVNLKGTPTSGSYNSYAYYMDNLGNYARHVKNNIFSNNRSNSNTASGKHYAAYYNYDLTGSSSLNQDNNNYYVSGTGGVMAGTFSGTLREVNQLPIFPTFYDLSSFSVNPTFSNAAGSSPADFVPSSASLSALNINSIPNFTNTLSYSTDFTGKARNVFATTMGAYETTNVSKITVNATIGTLSKTYNTINDAFAGINNGFHQGVITISLTGSTIETGTAILRASGFQNALYSSITIMPKVPNLTITGNVNGPLIDFYGSKGVILDGRVNGAGTLTSTSLVISNTSTSTLANTIRFVADAANNIVRYTTIKGAGTSSTNGVILFLSSASTKGVTNNIIDRNNITSVSDVARPINAIYSNSSASYPNTFMTISNNNFYNFLNPNFASSGINLNDYSDNWTIRGNSFYETSSFAPTTNSTHSIININAINSKNNFNIIGNYIGGTAPNAGGSPWVKTNSNDNIFYAINLNCSPSGVQANVHSNIITNFDYSNSAASSFIGINSTSGTINIGTKGGNIIGAVSGNNAIVYKAGSNNGNFYGMYLSGSSPIYSQNNTIGAIKTDNADVNLATHFYGIYRQNGYLFFNNNTLGSKDVNTTNSIDLASTSSSNGQSAYGVYMTPSSTGNATAHISNNTINKIRNQNNQSTASSGVVNGINLSAYSTSYVVSGLVTNNIISDLSIANSNANANSTAAVIGINNNNYQISGTFASQYISNNTIYNLSNTSDNFAGNLIGLYLSSTNTKNLVNANFIYGLAATGSNSVAASLFGTKIDKGSFRLTNNIVSLGGSSKSNLYGLFVGAGFSMDTYVYYNTIQISGTVNSGTNTSTAFYIADRNSVRDIRNNIFSNARSTSGGSNLHFAYYMPAITGSSAFTSNYNNYIVSGTGGTLGYYNGANKTTSNITGVDANSISTNPIFGSDLTLKSSYSTSASLPAIALTDVLLDFNDVARNSINPLMGAIESSVISNTVNVYNGSVLLSSYQNLKSAFDAINAGTHTGTITIQLIDNQTLTNPAVLNESGIGNANYRTVHIFPTIAGLSISGNIPMPLIYLNGADSVTIDGRVNGVGSTKSLEIVNYNTSYDKGNATVKIENDATKFTLQYCILKGGTLSSEDGIFTIGNTSSLGNDQVVIANNSFTNAYNDATKAPANSIYIKAATAGFENDRITINNNHFYDNFNTFMSGVVGNAINIQSNNSNITISNNSIFKPNNLASSVSTTLYGIYLYGTIGCNLTNNYIGGSAPQASGAAFIMDGTVNNQFYAISVFSSSSIPHQIQGNVITNIDVRRSTFFSGIYIDGTGAFNVGDISSNIIGASTGNNAILFKGYSAQNTFYGIYTNSGGNILIKNNSIGSITSSATGPTLSSNLYGIFVPNNSTNKLRIINNTIGSIDDATTNSLWATSSSTANAQVVRGIYVTSGYTNYIIGNTIAKLNNSATGSLAHTLQGISVTNNSTIIDNTIYDLYSGSDFNIDATSNSAIIGIVQSGSSTGFNSFIQNNKIYNLINTGASASTVNITGIHFSGINTGTNYISNNLIYNLIPNTNSTGTNVTGIKIASGTTEYSNNIINIGGDVRANFTGIYETGAVGNDNKFYYNTINLSGSVSAGSNPSYALYSAVNTNSKDFKNNILVNTRSTTSGSNLHYALYVLSGTNTVTADYNNYFVSGTGGVLGFYGTNVNNSIIVPGNDANSVSSNPSFSNGNSNPVLNFYPASFITAFSIPTITTDYLNRIRSNTQPIVGAIEYGTLTNTVDVFAGNVFQASYPFLNNAFDAINAGTHTGTIDVKIKASSILTSSAVLNANGFGNANYSIIKIFPTVANVSISGNIESPLIDLNGADNVTFDGRINGDINSNTVDLSFINNSISNSSEVSTFRFVNSAENNTLSYLTIKGASTSTTNNSGNIYFSPSTSGNGNDNNTIDHCNLTGLNLTVRPFVLISTSTGTASIFDNGNTISNNNFYDFSISNNFSKGAVYLTGFSNNFKIINNHFYETQTIVPSVSSSKFYGVFVNSVSNNVSHTIQGNYFGGTNVQAGGSPMTFTPTSVISYQVFPIYVNSIASTSPNSIQGNVIKNILINSNTSNAPFIGISVWSGLANIGTLTGNTIGSNVGNGSITINDFNLTTSNSAIGIYANSAYAVNISNNTIGSITTNGANISAIYTGTGYGTVNISNNLIGTNDEATQNSLIVLNPTRAYARSICGICNFGNGINIINNNNISKLVNNGLASTTNSVFGIIGINGTQTITNNTIKDLTNNSNTSTYSNYVNSNGVYSAMETGPAITGIYVYPGATSTVNNVSNNKIFNLYRLVSQSTGSYVRAIAYYSRMNAVLNINANFINNIVHGPSNTAGFIYGISQYAGTGTVSVINNVVSIGGDFSSSTIYGGNATSSEGNTLNLFYNTFNIFGKSTSSNSSDYAYYAIPPAGNLKNIQNNLFVNTRSNTSTNSSIYHYGLYLSDNIPQNSLILNNNNYYVGAGIGRSLGYNTNAVNSVPLISGLDANSVSINPVFSNPKGISPYEYKSGILFNGVTVSATNIDYVASIRGAIPNMGAFDKLAVPQTITFNALPTKTYGDANFQLTASGGNSGNPIIFSSSDTTIAKCIGSNGSIVSIVKAGTVSITANQLGNPVYSAAMPVSQNLVINKASQTINLAPLPIGNVSLNTFVGTIPVIATATSGLSVTVSLAGNSAASLNASNELYNIGSSGTVTINLFQAGNSNYNPAVATYRFDVVKANQSITFNNIADRTYAGSPITINTAGLAISDAGLPITYTIQSGPATITSNTITITGAGTVKITASQIGNAQYNAAESVTQSLNILKGVQSISFSALSNKSYGDAPFIVVATGGSSSSPVTFTSADPTIASCSGLNGSIVTILKAGTVSITASQIGDLFYDDAAPITQTLVIDKINQTLTLNPLPVNGMTLAEFGVPIQLSGTSTSGLPIVFSLGNETTAFINDESQLENVDRQGTIVITLTQEGDINYNPATVSYTFDVTKSNQTIYFDPLADLIYTDGLTLNLGATSTSALTVSYEVQSGPATVTNSTLTLTGPGQVVIKASQEGNNIYNPAGNVIQTLNVNPKVNQNLFFNSIPDQVIRSGTYTFTISSIAGESGNPVTYTSSDPSIATISGTNTATVTVYKTGYVQITANQAASSSYALASMTRSFNVTKPLLTITANNITKNFGQTLTNSNSYSNFIATGLTGNETIGTVSVQFINAASANTLPDTYSGDIVISNANGGTFNPNNYDIVYVNGDVIVNGVAPTYLTYPTVSFSTGNLTTVTPNTDASLPYNPTVNITISPSLPAGLNLDVATGVISGTPVGTSSNTYTVTLNNDFGTITGTVLINVTSIPQAPIINYTNSIYEFTNGLDIGIISPNITNPVSSFSINPSLPAGLILNTSNGEITGTATTTSSNTIYTITATNAGGSGTATISIIVNPPPPPAPIITYASSFNIFNAGSLIGNIIPTVTGIANSWTITPSLPAGLLFNTTTGVISGTPTAVSDNAFYVISATNAGGTGGTIVAIQVDVASNPPAAPPIAPTISYVSNTNVFTVGTTISTISATVFGTVTGWSINPTLPTGLTFNTGTGSITGTPSAAISNTTYTITATNNGSIGTTTVTIQVNATTLSPTSPIVPAAPILTYSNNINVLRVGTPISTISATVTGTVLNWSITPNLVAGLTFNVNNGSITGTPLVTISNTIYTINATNSLGTGTTTITIQVNAAIQSPTVPSLPQAPVISYTNAVNKFKVGTSIATLNPTVTGTVSSWSISPSLVSGLIFNTSNGSISGTPSSVMSNTIFTISATNTIGTGSTAISIQVDGATQSPTTPIVPNVNPITGPNSICGLNNSIKLSNTTEGGVWTSNKPLVASVSSDGLVVGISNSNDTLTILYTVTVNGISNSAYYKVKYEANPIKGINMKPIDLIVNEPTLINARNIGSTYQWYADVNLSKILSSTSIQSPYATISNEVTFNIKITSLLGCITIDTLQARAFKEKTVFVPNTFTPNGDGINDVFKLNPIGIKQLFYFAIYNNRGLKLFETNNVNEGWDGKLNGVYQPVASYPWVLLATDISGKQIKETGTVTLLR